MMSASNAPPTPPLHHSYQSCHLMKALLCPCQRWHTYPTTPKAKTRKKEQHRKEKRKKKPPHLPQPSPHRSTPQPLHHPPRHNLMHRPRNMQPIQPKVPPHAAPTPGIIQIVLAEIHVISLPIELGIPLAAARQMRDALQAIRVRVLVGEGR